MSKEKDEFPKEFPFWARIKICKNRPTLVIDETEVINKKTKKLEPGFVHREATHTEKKDYEKLDPNPDPSDKMPMYLKRPSKIPRKMVKPINKKLRIPKSLVEKYKK